MITMQQFKQLVPNTKYPQQWYDALFGKQTELNGKSLAEDYEINTPKRIAAFMAQCGHESGGFVWLTENLNYSAAGLMKTFAKYFPDQSTALAYARQPDKIANKVYANRMGNGPESSGDGARYKGRGLIQVTGKDNYFWFASSLGITPEEASEYMQTFEGAAQSACWFWEQASLNKLADAGDIKELTRRINGAYIGLEDRIKHYNHALSIMQGGH
jgi:putative chitinase